MEGHEYKFCQDAKGQSIVRTQCNIMINNITITTATTTSGTIIVNTIIIKINNKNVQPTRFLFIFFLLCI